jgi:hypothetical protein
MTKLFTFTGIPVMEIPAKLAEPFNDPKAYKGVPGGADLTDICTGHMIERITQVFGPKGIGWNFLWSAEDMEILNPLERRVLARLKQAVFSYVLLDESGAPHPFEIQTSGANANELVYAEEGARTSALGAAVKGLCFQLPVYKGQLDHHNAAQLSSGNGHKPGGNGHHMVHSGEVQRLVEPPPGINDPSLPDEVQTALNGITRYFLKTGTQSKGKQLGEISLRTLGWFALTMKPVTADQVADQEAVLLYLTVCFVPVKDEEASIQQQAFARLALLNPATPAGKAAKALTQQKQLA